MWKNRSQFFEYNRKYFDVDGEPTPNTLGCVYWQLETDEEGAAVKMYYDVVGNVVKTE